MERDEQIRLLKHLIHQLDSGTNLDAGVLLKAPAAVYRCAERAALEKQHFFQGYPQMIGMSGDLPKPGAFLTRDVGGVKLLATRDDEGRFRAFHNACRHRGVSVEPEERGTRKRFVCPFHAWTYSSSGELVGIPKTEHFGEIDKACRGLIEFPAEEAAGVLLVHPQLDGVIETDRVLEGLGPDFESYGFPDYVYAGSDVYDVPINWKLAIDTFGETYHFSALHRNTLWPVFHGNVQGFDHWERNHRMILCTREIDEMRERPESEWSIRGPAFPVYWLFPNVMFNVGRQSVIVVRVLPHPTEVGRSISEISFYLDPALANATDGDNSPAEIARTFGEVIRDEDYAAAAGSQRAADSGLQDHFVFGRNEPTLHHYHNTYNRELGLPPLEELDAANGGPATG